MSVRWCDWVHVYVLVASWSVYIPQNLVFYVNFLQAQDIPEELLSRMVSMVDTVVETSLVSSAVLLEDTSRLDGFTEEDKGKFVDIPLEGGLLQIEVRLGWFCTHTGGNKIDHILQT